MNSVFGANPSAAAQMLRRIAARNLHLDEVVVHGTVEEYASLSAANQVRLTDEMARLIVQYPAGFSEDVVAEARRRVANPLFNQPLADPSMSSSLIEGIADGSIVDAMMGGARSYLMTIALIGGAVLLGFMLLQDTRRNW